MLISSTDYFVGAKSAKEKVEAVKKSVKEQEQILIGRFYQGISKFAEAAKQRIQDEIDQIVESKSGELRESLASAARNNVSLTAA